MPPNFSLNRFGEVKCDFILTTPHHFRSSMLKCLGKIALLTLVSTRLRNRICFAWSRKRGLKVISQWVSRNPQCHICSRFYLSQLAYQTVGPIHQPTNQAARPPAPAYHSGGRLDFHGARSCPRFQFRCHFLFAFFSLNLSNFPSLV